MDCNKTINDLLKLSPTLFIREMKEIFKLYKDIIVIKKVPYYCIINLYVL